MTIARMDGEDFAAFLTRELGQPSTTDWPTARLQQVIQMAEVDIALMMKPPELLTSVDVAVTSGTSSFALGVTNVLWMEKLAYNTTLGGLIRHETFDGWRRRNTGATVVTGTIIYWAEFGASSSQKVIYYHAQPTSSQTIRHYYGKYPTGVVTTPTANATSSDLPQWCDQLICYCAAMKACQWDGQPKRATDWAKALAQAAMVAAKANDCPLEVRHNIETIVGKATR